MYIGRIYSCGTPRTPENDVVDFGRGTESLWRRAAASRKRRPTPVEIKWKALRVSGPDRRSPPWDRRENKRWTLETHLMVIITYVLPLELSLLCTGPREVMTSDTVKLVRYGDAIMANIKWTWSTDVGDDLKRALNMLEERLVWR